MIDSHQLRMEFLEIALKHFVHHHFAFLIRSNNCHGAVAHSFCSWFSVFHHICSSHRPPSFERLLSNFLSRFVKYAIRLHFHFDLWSCATTFPKYVCHTITAFPCHCSFVFSVFLRVALHRIADDTGHTSRADCPHSSSPAYGQDAQR